MFQMNCTILKLTTFGQHCVSYQQGSGTHPM